VRPWDVLLVVSGVWNAWHTIQQRYGILRIYAGKAGGGLEERSAATRDRVLVWTLIAVLAVLLPAFRAGTFEGHRNARRTLAVLTPLIESSVFAWIAGIVLVAGCVVAVRWARAEWRPTITPIARAPRLWFLASTIALFAVFLVHGPIVGYLTFGTAHAVEYVAFVHHFGERKFRPPSDRSVAAALFSRPLVAAPFLIGGLGVAYLALQGVADSDAYLTYYFGTSMLHFLYDGWIWKVRRPEVAAPLGARPSPPSPA
jgi:hypothetical protein